MEITVTVNPSVDRLYELKQLKVGQLNRVQLIKKMVGGKGINAARVSANLGAKTVATGFLAGSNGKYILEQAKNDQYKCNFIETNGNTRNCYTIIQNNGEKTEINEYGDHIPLQYFNQLLETIEQLITKNKVAAISLNGSLPPSEIHNFYPQIIAKVRDLNPDIKIVLDTSGKALAEVLNSDNLPDFIKPNETEVAELLAFPVTKDYSILRKEILTSKLIKIPNIIVSLGEKGALFKHEHDFYSIKLKPVKVVNTEGSGDSLVGGLLYALGKNYDFKEAIKWAIASGTANAMETKTGFVELSKVLEIIKTIKIERIAD